MHARPAAQVSDAAGTRPRTGSLLILGSILMITGVLAVIARAADIDVFSEQTWPLLVIVPGLVLAALAATRTPPEGLGFAIGGSIVTTVGLILLVQANTDTWASWAYVWTLIPGAAGVGKLLYGAATRSSELVGDGLRLILIAGAMFVVGWWYFETLFATGEQPVDVATWWPVVIIGFGAVIAIRALLTTRHGPGRTAS